MSSIDEFLATGRLGPIACGMTPREVEIALGPPDDVSVQKRPTIWKYDALQLAFFKTPDATDPLLSSIVLGFYHPEDLIPGRLGLQGWKPTAETTVDEFQTHLSEAGLEEFRLVDPDGFQHFVLPSEVRVTFEDGKLYRIGHSGKRGPVWKQVSVSLDPDAVEIIRREAAALGVSVATLCSRWIGERIANRQPQ